MSNGTLDFLSAFSLNETVCIRVDEVFVDLIDMRRRGYAEVRDPSSIVVPVFGLFASVVILVFGARLFRVSAAMAAGVFGFWMSYSFVRTSGRDVSCEATLAVASVLGVVAAISAGCMLKAGLFFVGAAACAALVHLVFSAFPDLHEVGDPPTIAERSLVYWGLLLLAGVSGGLLVRWNSKPILEVTTSLVGGAGFAYSLHSIGDVASLDVENWVFMLSGLVATLVGILVQRHIRLRGCRRRKNREANPELARHV